MARTRLPEKIVVIDKRNAQEKRRSKHVVSIVDSDPSQIIFDAKGNFPVPASNRYFYYKGRRFILEEIDANPRQNKYRFSGLSIRSKTT